MWTEMFLQKWGQIPHGNVAIGGRGIEDWPRAPKERTAVRGRFCLSLVEEMFDRE